MTQETLSGIPKLLQTRFTELARREQNVARVILHDYPMSAVSTVAVIAAEANVSTATVLRLINRLGFESFGEFQAAVKGDVARLLQSPALRLRSAEGAGRKDATQNFADRYFAAAQDNLSRARSDLIAGDFDRAVGLLGDLRSTIWCIGGRYSGHVAQMTSEYLGLLRPGVRVVDGQSEGWSRFLLDMDTRSVVLAFDIRRYQASVVGFARSAAEAGAKIILVTDVWRKDLPFAADLVFPLPATTVSAMDSFVVHLGFAEALVGALAFALGERGQMRLDTVEQGRHLDRDPQQVQKNEEKDDG